MFVGWIAGCLSVSQLLPQIARLYKIKNASQISRYSLGVRVLSHALYMLHAWEPPFDSPLFWMTFVGLVLSLAVCGQIAYYDGLCLIHPEKDSSSFSTSSQANSLQSDIDSVYSMGNGENFSEKKKGES